MSEIYSFLGVCFLWGIKIYLGLAGLRSLELYGAGWTLKEIYNRFDNRLLFTNLTKEQYNEAFAVQEIKRDPVSKQRRDHYLWK